MGHSDTSGHRSAARRRRSALVALLVHGVAAVTLVGAFLLLVPSDPDRDGAPESAAVEVAAGEMPSSYG